MTEIEFERAISAANTELVKLRADMDGLQQQHAAMCQQVERLQAQLIGEHRDRAGAYALVERDVRALILPVDLRFRRGTITVACALGTIQRVTLLDAVEDAIDIGGEG